MVVCTRVWTAAAPAPHSNPPPPSQPTPRIQNRINATPPATTDNLDWHKLNSPVRVGGGQQHLRLKFEVIRLQLQSGPCPEVDQPKAALGVWQSPAGELANAPAHPPVDGAPNPGDFLRVMHAISHNQGGACLLGASQEGGDVLGPVLAIAIQRDCPAAAPGTCRLDTRLNGCTLAGMLQPPDDFCSRLGCPWGSSVF